MLSPKHFWTPGRFDPYDACPGRNCDRLQHVARTKPARRMSEVLKKAHPDGAIVFGGLFSMDPQALCNSPGTQQQQPKQELQSQRDVEGRRDAFECTDSTTRFPTEGSQQILIEQVAMRQIKSNHPAMSETQHDRMMSDSFSGQHTMRGAIIPSEVP